MSNLTVIICHDRERTYAAITWLKEDPREYDVMIAKGRWDKDGDYVKYKKTRA